MRRIAVERVADCRSITQSQKNSASSWSLFPVRRMKKVTRGFPRVERGKEKNDTTRRVH